MVHRFRHVAVLNTDTCCVSIAVCDKHAVHLLRSAALLPTDTCSFYCSVWYTRGTSPSIRSCTSYRHVLFLLQCLGQTWYIAADAQLYFLSPVLLFPLQYWPRFGLGLTFAALIAAFFTIFGIYYVTEEHVDIYRGVSPK